ncbi:MAG: hypothetical protein OEY66_06655 [Gammaproteobacteria bacterium]|nr:hypothetical protein [Gammaproteobacteria bacterium]
MNPYTYVISLRVKHPTQDLSYLDSLLEIKAKGGWLAGEQRMTPKGTILDGRYTDSYWYSVITNDPEESDNIDIETSLEEWTNKLSTHSAELNRITNEGGTIEYFIWIYCDRNLGIDISPNLMKNISSLGISLGVVCDP